MTADEVSVMPIFDRVRKIKIHTPGQYDLHAWIDRHHHNGLVVDTVLLIVANGGKLANGRSNAS